MGGFVRRRRWVRLMMRPGKAKRALLEMDQPSGVADGEIVGHDHPSWIASILEGRSTTASSVLSISTHASEPLDQLPNTITDDVWQGCDTDQQWARCHALMNRLGRDGRKLEMWKKWLEPCITHNDSSTTGRDKGKQRQMSGVEDNSPQSSGILIPGGSPAPIASGTCSPSLDHVASVIRMHVSMNNAHSLDLMRNSLSTGGLYPSFIRISRVSIPIHQAPGPSRAIDAFIFQA